MSKILLVALLLASCGDKSPAPQPPATFDQQLYRTELVTCAEITYHDYGETPDCRRIYEAWVRGRNRVAKLYPVAADYRMAAITFYRPKLTAHPDLNYPLIDAPGTPRGLSYMQGGVMITYAYEEVIEHEATHVLVFLVDGLKVREPDMIAKSMGGYDPAYFMNIPFWFYLIACHGTPDDPFRQAGERDLCIAPFQGPADWRARIAL